MSRRENIGPYRIVRELGHGLGTEVFEAVGPQGTVALKVASSTADMEENLNIREEFRSLSNIDHPNVVTVYDFGTTEDGRPFFTMELIKGRHFRQAFKGPSRPFFIALSQILNALHNIHYLGYVHGDIKPENILVSREGKAVSAKLTDFGMARNLGVTAAAIPRGTPGYMAPEVFTGMTPDARSDLYSLGVVVYETLIGRSAFGAKDPRALLKDRLTVELPPVSMWVKDVPPPLERILEKMTRTLPENRPRDALEILDGLKELLPEDTLAGIERGRRPLLSSSLVGRTRELKRLVSLAKTTSGSRNAAGLIAGPPGIGKSRLLRELKIRAQLEGMHVIGLSCASSDLRPLGPFSDLATGERRGPDMAGELPEREIRAREQLIRQFELIAGHFSRLSRDIDRKVLILIDNLELGGANLRLLLQYLYRYCRTRHGLVCVATAENDIWKRTAEEDFEYDLTELDPLSETRTRKLASNMMGLQVPLDLARWVHRYSGGMPLLVEETVSWLHRNSVITGGDGHRIRWNRIRRKKPPRTIGALTRLLVKGLKKEELEVLARASVVGDIFDQDILVSISEYSDRDVSAILRSLQSRNLIQKEAGNKYSFAHMWLAAALYSRIDEHERKALHKRILNALESARAASHFELAHHAERADLKAKTFHYSIAAAREAREGCSFDSSVELFKLALSKLQETDPRHRRIVEELADAQVWKGDYRSAISYYVSLFSRIRAAGDRARVLRKAALSRHHLGETKAAASLLEKARALTEGSRSRERARVLLISGWNEKKMGNHENARAYLNRALDLSLLLRDHELACRTYCALGGVEHELGQVSAARELSLKAISAGKLSGVRHSISAGLYLLASIEMESGQLEEAASHLNEVLALERETNYLSGQGSCLVNLALAEQRLGRLEGARRHQEEALGIFLRLHEDAMAAAAENNLGFLYDVTGDWDRALKHYASALDRYERLGHERWIAVCHLNTGLLQILMGEHVKGLLNMEQALKFSDSADYWAPAVQAYEAMSISFVNQGKPEDALKKARQAVQVAKEKGLSRASPLLQESQVYLTLNDRSSALEAYEKASELQDSDPYIRGKRLRLEAELFPENAAKSISESISIFEKLNDRFELAKTLLVQAGLYADEKLLPAEDRPIDAAVTAAEKALDIFRSLGAKPYASISTKQIAEYKKKARSATDAENVYLKTIFAVNRMVDLLTDEKDMLDEVLDRVIDILGAERGMVLLLDEEENLIPAAGRKIDRQSEKDITHISRTVVRSVARSGRPEVSANASDDPRYMSMHSITLHGIKSLMCVPLINRGEAIGALYVDHTLLRNLFTPYDDQFLMTVGNLLAASIDKSRYIDRLETQNVELKRLLHQSFSSGNIIGGSPEMTRVRKLVHRFGLTDQNVLIVGEKGTGKSLIARALHFESPRSNRPFITVDSAHIPAQLIEDALFGHVKGAYSGAYSDSQGLIESASGGTVFLDNVDSIPLDIQAKLVRPLETGEVRRLGSTRTKHVDFKIISASSIPLEQLVEKGRFRLDLYYVLGVLEITLPGLKERGIDVHELASHFLERFAARAGKSIRGFSKEALDAISSYSWPGNVTQLEKCIERAAALCRGEVVTAREIGLDLPAAPRPAPTLGSSRDFAEFSELSSAMIQCSGNVTRAAAVLGMSRRQVQRLLKKHSLLAAQFKPSPGKKTTHPRKTGPRGTHDNAKRRKNLQR